jgi:hypothetical protein
MRQPIGATKAELAVSVPVFVGTDISAPEAVSPELPAEAARHRSSGETARRHSLRAIIGTPFLLR